MPQHIHPGPMSQPHPPFVDPPFPPQVARPTSPASPASFLNVLHNLRELPRHRRMPVPLGGLNTT